MSSRYLNVPDTKCRVNASMNARGRVPKRPVVPILPRPVPLPSTRGTPEVLTYLRGVGQEQNDRGVSPGRRVFLEMDPRRSFARSVKVLIDRGSMAARFDAALLPSFQVFFFFFRSEISG